MISGAWLAVRKGLYSSCRSDYVTEWGGYYEAPSGASFVLP
jgi:hypothetical protein